MKYLISLIHNNDENRRSSALNSLQNLTGVFSSDHSFDVIEIYNQPNIEPLSVVSTMIREEQQVILHSQWRTYTQNQHYPFLETEIGLRKSPVKATIEISLTDKHVRAWDRFLDSDADFLMCAEDDIFLHQTSCPQFELMTHLTKDKVGQRVYIDLAGGFPLEVLSVSSLQTLNAGRYIVFDVGVTNTSCCYLLSKPLASFFKSQVLHNPNFRHLCADWLLNKLFVTANIADLQVFCAHLTPGVFLHGSLLGLIPSMIQSESSSSSH